ncbi:MAG: RNA-directed DNA polymerase [Geothrix sp.]|nr:RNA-directed DNA polymerase [Geothrix sp.]
MFTLTGVELDNAFAAIAHHGYSTMLPDPPEWDVVANNWPAVRNVLEKIDLDTYEPFKVMKVFAPKSRANIRVVHLLHPQDLLLYTALVLITKNDIEANRVGIKAKRVFSYRADITKPQVIYGSKGSYEAYRQQLDAKAETAQVKFVAMADIADFYPRIYQHRLENVIETVATSQRVRDVARVLVRKLIGNLMERNSYGIPVGPYASRLLGEAILIDVDATLQSKGINFVRWVDDYNIFCKSEYEAQSVLFGLGEWLYSNHGLTLQSAKTKILPIDVYKIEVLSRHEEQLTDRDTVVNMFRDFSIGYENGEEGEPNESEVQEALAVLQGTDLKGMLEASLADTSLVDYEAVVYALTKLPRIPGAPPTLKREVLDLVIENAELLYPLAEQMAKYVLSFEDLTRAEQRRVSTKLLSPLKSKRNPPPPYYAMWILHIFASGSVWNHAGDIVSLYSESTSEVVKRHAALALHSSGNRSEAVAIKDDYVGASPLLRLAILFASRKLGVDERKHWKLANGISGAIEKLI